MIPGEYKIRIGKDLQTGKFSVSLPAWQKKASYIEEISTMVNMIFHC